MTKIPEHRCQEHLVYNWLQDRQTYEVTCGVCGEIQFWDNLPETIQIGAEGKED